MTLKNSHINDKGLIYGNDSRHNRQEVIGVTNRTYEAVLGVEYAFTRQLSAEVYLPYVIHERLESANDNYYTGRGIGDVSLRGKYYIWEPTEDGWNPYAELGVAFPTGDGGKQFYNRRTRRREWMKPYITPGSGVWSPIFGVGVEKAFGDVQTYLNARYIATLGVNDAGYDPGDPFYATLGASYIVHRFSDKPDTAYIGVTNAINSLWVAGREQRDGVDVINTGGYFLRMEPGVFFSPDGGNFTMELSVPFPLYYNVHNLQTIERYGVNFTMGYRF